MADLFGFSNVNPGAPPMDPDEVPRGTNLTDIPGNAYHDFVGLGKPLGLLGSMAQTRFYEGLQGKLLVRPFDLSPQEPSDIATLGRTVGAIGQSYWDTYGRPIVEGRPGDILKYGIQHPFYAGTDALAAGSLFKFGKVASALGKTPLIAEATAKAAGIVTPPVKLLAKKIMEHPVLQKLGAAIEEHQAVGEAQKEFVQPTLEAINKDILGSSNTLFDLWNRIPPAERDLIKDYIQGTNPAALREINGLSAQANRFIAGQRTIAQQMAARGSEIGAWNEATIRQQQHLPYIQKNLLGGQSAKNLADNQLHGLVDIAGQEMGKFEPGYAPWMTEKEARGVLARNPFKLPHRTTNAARKWAVGASLEGEEIPPWARTRQGTDQPHYGKNMALLTQARYVQIAQAYHYFRNLLARAMAMSEKVEQALGPEGLKAAIAAGQIEAYNPGPLAQRIAAAVFGGGVKDAEAAAAAAVPKAIYIDPALAKALDGLLKDRSFFGKIISDVASVARRYILGANPIFAESQWVQNLGLVAFFQFRGIKDLSTTIAAYLLANSDEARAAIPAIIKGEVDMQQGGLRIFDSLGKPGQYFEKFVDKTFERTSRYDIQLRSATAIYYADHIARTMPEVGRILDGALTTGEQINRLERTFADPAAQKMIAEQVNTVLGDYTRLRMNTGVRPVLRASLLWWAWYEHILGWARALPFNAPYKLNIYLHLQQVASDLFSNPDIPEHLRKHGAYLLPNQKSPQGYAYIVLKGNLNPVETIPSFLRMVASPVDPHAEPGTMTSINPIFTLGLIVLATRTNPQTMREFQDPRLLHFQGKQYTAEEIAQGKLGEGQRPLPNLLELASRYIMPTPTRLVERMAAKLTTGGEPSQMTAMFPPEMAPKKDSQNNTLLATDVLNILAETASGTRRMPLDIEGAKLHEALQARNLKRAIKQLYQQHVAGADEALKGSVSYPDIAPPAP